MNPVIGLDVAKGESQVQAYLDKKKPYKMSFIKQKDCLGECKTCRSCPFVLHNGKVRKEENAKALYWEINKHIAQNEWKNAQTKN